MGLLARVKGWFDMLFNGKATEEFKVESIVSADMDRMIQYCQNIYQGKPEWLDKEEHIKTINFAKSICSETARLALLGTKITVDGSVRATWLQEQVNNVYYRLREWTEYGCAYGTVILKPNGETVDLITPGNFIVTDQSNGDITGVVFVSKEISGKKYYTRFEYHRFSEDGTYAITNRCFVGDSMNDVSKRIDIEKTPWAGLLEEVQIANVDKPLYGVLKMPQANNIDINSPLALSIFFDAIEELKDLDIAYSRNAKEIKDSKRIVLLDADRLLSGGGKIQNSSAGLDRKREEMGLPDYVKNVFGDGRESFYEEINPEINTEMRLKGINSLISQIGFKIGYSNGYFVFNEKTGMVTATQVESDDRRTIHFIKDVRDRLENCLDDLIYALNVFADLYDFAPVGAYEVVYDFGDITYNREEDRARWYGYVVANKIPFWYYLMKFEGFSEEEAKAIESQAQPKNLTLFGSEE